MNDREKTKEELIAELVELRDRIRSLDDANDRGGRLHRSSLLPGERWNSLLADTPLAILILDRDHRVVFTNHTDSSRCPSEVIGMTPYDFCQPESHDTIRECLNRVLETGEPGRCEAPAVRLDGERHWYESHVGPIVEDGEVMALSVILVNATARKQAEQKQSRSHAILNATMECLPFHFFALGVDGRYMLANSATKTSWGDLVGKTPEEICPNERDLTLWLENNRRALAGERVEGEVELAVHGENRHYYNVVTPIRDDDEVHGVLGVNVDITERVRAENALQKAHDEMERQVEQRTAELKAVNQQLQAIFDGTVDGLLVTDIETLCFLRANASICRMLGYSESELLSLTVRDIHPSDAVSHIGETIRAAAELGEPPLGTLPVQRKDGSVFYAEVIGNFLVYDGRPCSLGIFRDITERKQAQEALERERRTLFYMLRASDHERQLISYDIHDGLAQQLASAIMQLQAYDGLKKHDPEKAKTAYDAGFQMLQQAHREARRLISGVRPPILDESGIAAAVAHLVYDHATSTGPKVEFHSGVKVKRLANVLQNAVYRIAQEALTNALQHSGSERVKVSLVQSSNDLHLEVEDWGIGFDPKAVDENRFGLEGIRERTRLLGGELAIESERGRGTCIRVVLPIVEEQ